MSEQENQANEELKRKDYMIHNLSPTGIIEALEKELKHSEDNKKFFEDKISAINESLAKFK